MSGSNAQKQPSGRTRPDFPVQRKLFQTKTALTLLPLLMLMCGCLFCGATAYTMQRAPAGPAPMPDVVLVDYMAMLFCGGGLLLSLYVGGLVALGDLFNKATDEKIERDAEVYRRGFRE